MSNTITIDVDDATWDEFAKAAAQAGQTLNAYIIDAAHERRLRDAALRYDEACGHRPESAASAAARLAARSTAADMRAAVLAKYNR
ncbi:MAG TPA: hypothetical protein VKB69_05640 [Micromonosporaceae bacterium]|nr:hypothetical protein [Micromonosporaceae bacterium]